ncbi:hypothetical protein CHARACLAT_009130 [Characodon lateralis]|uniref:Uncharacterized protein n=1 Tax=Characodon lateralis TaxID=208331 RepID=A0ABU7CPV3_9TELE|nr:hypothetical protein [Characodon lateralis]
MIAFNFFYIKKICFCQMSLNPDFLTYRQNVTRTRKLKLKPEHTNPTMKYGGGTIMLWGSLSSEGTRQLVKAEGRGVSFEKQVSFSFQFTIMHKKSNNIH